MDEYSRQHVRGTLVVMAIMLTFLYWVAFPLNNMQFVNKYVHPATSTERKFSRYTFEWWAIYLLNINLVLPYLLAISLMNHDIPEVAQFHLYLARFAFFWNLAILIMLGVQWILFCNWSTSGGAMCNDPRWCCAEYSNGVVPASWCTNEVACVAPNNVSQGQLARSDEFWQAFLFSIIYFFLALFQVSTNKSLRDLGTFGEK